MFYHKILPLYIINLYYVADFKTLPPSTVGSHEIPPAYLSQPIVVHTTAPPAVQYKQQVYVYPASDIDQILTTPIIADTIPLGPICLS